MTIFDTPDDSRHFLPSELEDYGMCPPTEEELSPEEEDLLDSDEDFLPPPLSATPT